MALQRSILNDANERKSSIAEKMKELQNRITDLDKDPDNNPNNREKNEKKIEELTIEKEKLTKNMEQINKIINSTYYME